MVTQTTLFRSARKNENSNINWPHDDNSRDSRFGHLEVKTNKCFPKTTNDNNDNSWRVVGSIEIDFTQNTPAVNAGVKELVND